MTSVAAKKKAVPAALASDNTEKKSTSPTSKANKRHQEAAALSAEAPESANTSTDLPPEAGHEGANDEARADEVAPPPVADDDGAKIDEAPADEAPPPTSPAPPDAIVPSQPALITGLEGYEVVEGEILEPGEVVCVEELSAPQNRKLARDLAEIHKLQVVGRAAQRQAAVAWIKIGQHMRAIKEVLTKAKGKTFALAWIAAHTGYKLRHVRDAIRVAGDAPEKVVGKIGVGAYLELKRRGVPAAALEEFLALDKAERTRKKAEEIAKRQRNGTVQPKASSGKKEDQEEEDSKAKPDPVNNLINSIEILERIEPLLKKLDTNHQKFIVSNQGRLDADQYVAEIRALLEEWTSP
jgi:hypothetical protein